MTTLDLRGRLTLSVYPETAQLYGLGRDATYAAVERGEIPSIRVGRTIRVPTHAALRQLGWPDESIARALGVDVDDDDDAPQDTEALSATERATATIYAFGQKNGDRTHGATPPAG